MTWDWTKASRQSAQIAPSPQDEPQALVHLYTARAFAWRGYFSVHSWIALKEQNADHYVVLHVLMWGSYYGHSVVSIQKDIPDRYWYGAKPSLIFCEKGEKAQNMIAKIYEAAANYPYLQYYNAYPGPNSNTFISHIMRKVDGFKVELPSNAIGKDWIHNARFFGLTETRSGIQFSIYGMLGILCGIREGIEINIIGFSFGIDFLRPALKLPIIGRVGFKK